MSDPTTSSVALSPPRFIRPRWFLAGLGLGLVLLAGLGRRAASADYHAGFTRFFPTISPEASYYPTVDEMCSIVRARCRPDQVLVIVGGNSVLYGVWQPAEVMWSKRLQEQLGDGYCVINFALRGAMPTDGGAIIAEVLRNEFPRQIYIANEKPGLGLYPIGNQPYRFVFWEAYFSGRLLPDAARSARVREFWQKFDRQGELAGAAQSTLLDRIFRFRDFWNRTAFEWLNTIPSIYAPAPPALFRPRNRFADDEPDGALSDLNQRYLPSVRQEEMKILRFGTGLGYQRDVTGGWVMKPATRTELDMRYGEGFPVPLRSRTLLLIGRDSSFYRQQLTADERERDEQGVSDTVRMLRAHGYEALDYGRDFKDDDYGDRIHLAPAGGQKLADAVAPQVRAMAEKLGYAK